MTTRTLGDLSRKSATALVALMRAKSASPVEVLQAHLDTIARANGKVNAICTLAAESAMEAARRAERAILRGEPTGSLIGLPVGIKDVTPTAGIRTTYGSPLFAHNIPTEDAAVVARLKDAGAIILGKTNTPEFAAGANTVNPVFGATRNPWNLALTVGGSTGGGGAAVATGMIALAEGTDFGGSLRVPAAFCGVVGLRPTVGLVPSHPAPQPWDDGRTHGPMARTAEDVALMLEAIVGVSNLSPISTPAPWRDLAATVGATRDARGLRLAYSADIAGVGVDPEIGAVCHAAALRLVEAGASVEEIALDFSEGCDAYRTLRGQWMVQQYAERLDSLDRFGPNLARNVEAGLALTPREIAAAEATRARLWHRWRAALERYDLILTPTVPVPPFPVEQNYPETVAGKKMQTYIDWIAPTFLVTLGGLPACSVPCGTTVAGMPVGLQIIGRRFDEPRILGLAQLVQKAHPLGWPGLGAGDA
ncbi:MAG TPA: amidase family protein [Alphaproteobacteria bacterium]|nr:amidase family protein [Alphaproteobacteria bacterium]